MEKVSEDTQATLLLMGRFEASPKVEPYKAAEYNKLAQQLVKLSLRPRDLLKGIPDGLVVERTRVEHLLSRGTALTLAVERWSQLGIRVIGRGDTGYPTILRTKLKSATAPIIYVAGDAAILSKDGLCVVGSRDATEGGLAFAARLGRLAAAGNWAVISGDARGVDRAAMDAALEADGSVIGVIVESLEKAVLAKANRQALLRGKLVLMSAFGPDSRFSVPAAMERNKYLYGLAKAAVVVDSDVKGGTWTGAVENDKNRWTPAFVRLGPDAPAGNKKLADMGLPTLTGGDWSWSELLSKIEAGAAVREAPQMDLLNGREIPAATDASNSPVFEAFLTSLLTWLSDGPKSVGDIAQKYDLVDAQVLRWLSHGADTGLIEQSNGLARSAQPRVRVGSTGR